MKNTINHIINQIDEVQQKVAANKPFHDDENHEEALDELTRAADALEEVCSIFERDEAYQEAKQQMQFSL
jgi:MinD-like ATPase involved in chromosome partitioning or flagellar assembly